MSYRSNAQRIIDNLGLNYFGNKNDKLKMVDNVIFDTYTPIGTMFEYFNEEKDCYEQYIILTLQNFKSQPSWKAHKKQLAKAANECGIPIIFVPEFDIGFGANNEDKSIEVKAENYYKDLIEVAKYSQDKDIKTAACAIIPSQRDNEHHKIVAYTFNQDLGEEHIVHAEQILCDYIKAIDIKLRNEYIFVSLLEPCKDCLLQMLQCNATKVFYSEMHKSKWTTADYIQLVNDIFTRALRGKNDKPIVYRRVENNKVTKFYNKGEKV